jgi:hypothetical protein
MAKSTKKKRLELFRLDFSLLRTRYSNGEIAEKLDVDPTNLSAYYTGGKTPGEGFLKKFFLIFAEEIKEIKESGYQSEPESFSTGESSSSSEESTYGYMHTDKQADHIHTLKINNQDLRDKMGQVIESNQTLARSTEILALNNQKLVEAHISILDRLKRPANNDPNGQA